MVESEIHPNWNESHYFNNLVTEIEKLSFLRRIVSSGLSQQDCFAQSGLQHDQVPGQVLQDLPGNVHEAVVN